MSTIESAQLPIKDGFAIVRAEMADTDTKEIGKRLATIRRALKLSQKVMAFRIGETQEGGPQKWNNWERGRDKIPVPAAIKVCIVSGADLDYIYRGLMGGLTDEFTAKLDNTERAVRRIRRA